MNKVFNIGDEVLCVEDRILEGNDYGPEVYKGKTYTIKDICLDKDGNQHLDVGLVSKLNYVRSFETKEELPNGNKIHWCHPSRFE